MKKKAVSCLVAAGVLASGAMGFAIVQQKQVTPETELVAMEREVPRVASRGSERSENAYAVEVAASAQRSDYGSPADQPDATTTTTSTSTTTSTTTAPKPQPKPEEKAEVKKSESAPKPAPKPAVNDTGVVGDDVWTKLAACESGNRNYTAGPFYGYFQFLPSTWRAMGGTGLPSDHSYETQKAMAQKLQLRSGWGQWPACSRKLGLR